MSYQALARTLRPKDFSSVVGQEHVIKALQNSINQNMLHHAYLLTGTRGVGKTTIARIFAKCLNCESGLTANPCGSCNACISIDNHSFPDLIEIDAASKTKVEDTRELLDSVMYTPTLGRYKVYIIDEVHMLSTHSFNAFLKTLEEPPEHVKFILATTDPKKLPVTVLSRCLQFNLRHASQKNLNDLLENILKEKNISYDSSAVNLIAKQANGSIRDLLSILEQVIALDSEKLSYDNARLMLGNVSYLDIIDLLNLVVTNNNQAVFAALDKMSANNIDFSLFLEQFLEVLHNLSIVKHIDNVSPQAFENYKNSLFDYISLDKLLDILNKVSAENIQYYYQTVQLAYKDLEFMPDAYMVASMAFLRMLAFYADFDINNNFENNNDSNNQKLTKLEPKLEPKPETEIKLDPVVKPEASINKTDFDWVNLVSKLSLRGLEKQLIEHLEYKNFDSNILTLNLSKNMACLLTDSRKADLEDKISNLLKNRVKLKINISEDALDNTIAAKNNADYQRKHQLAVEKLKQDPHVNELVKTFDANVDFNSLELIED